MKHKFMTGLLALLITGTFLCYGGCNFFTPSQLSSSSENVTESSEQQDSSSTEDEETNSGSSSSSTEDEETNSGSSSSSTEDEETNSSSSSSSTEDEEVPHVHTPNDDDGNCTTDIKCSECGETVTAGNAAHSYENACDSTCNNAGCNGHRLVGAHVDADSDKKCDHCGADIPQSGGVVELPEDKFE